MNITCPHCNFTKTVDPAKVPDRPVKVNCPKCSHGFTFDKSELPRKTEEQKKDNTETAMNGNIAELRRKAQGEISPQLQLKAGFWIRAVALTIDVLVVLAIQAILGFLLALIIGINSVAVEGNLGLDTVSWLFAVTIRFGYAVFFIGYCGQTPGKMALRIKVIRTNGNQISYGQAALREVLGKVVSAILFGIGYLMVAFDSNKQGLHDKIADTYVIKL